MEQEPSAEQFQNSDSEIENTVENEENIVVEPKENIVERAVTGTEENTAETDENTAIQVSCDDVTILENESSENHENVEIQSKELDIEGADSSQPTESNEPIIEEKEIAGLEDDFAQKNEDELISNLGEDRSLEIEEERVIERDSVLKKISEPCKKMCERGCALFLTMVNLMFQLHHSALSMLSKNSVAFTVFYIYAFPFIVSSLTDDASSAASIIWYAFLVWFFVNRGQSPSDGNVPSLNIRLLLPLLFVFEGVCNPKFIVLWNGGERLVLAFVLLSMKSNNFLDWSCFVSLALLIITSVSLGANILVQWAILVMALSSLSPSFSLNPLMKYDIVENVQGSCEDSGDHYNPSFEANLLPPATVVGFYSREDQVTKVSRTTKRNKRRH
mmetsp:Transcript_125096/g.186872  ORF Transcript_125096/g.186872 Transcript_125096/m.186872 type:complete len:388 (-) Transcript_125096:49-1212(-)